MRWSTYIVLSLMFLICTIAVAKINHENGRIEMCNELNMLYTSNHICESCEDTGREWFDGECRVRTISDNINFEDNLKNG